MEYPSPNPGALRTAPAAAQQLHLLVEAAAAQSPVPVEPGTAYVLTGGSRPGLSASAAGGSAEATAVESFLDQHGRPRLLLLNPARSRARINGQLAPLMAVLKEKDFVQFPEGFAAHVSVLHRPRIGVPAPELLGRVCPVCRVKFIADTKCYHCACGVALHCEDSAEGLQCVQTRKECACGRPIILQEQFTYLPETNHE